MQSEWQNRCWEQIHRKDSSSRPELEIGLPLAGGGGARGHSDCEQKHPPRWPVCIQLLCWRNSNFGKERVSCTRQQNYTLSQGVAVQTASQGTVLHWGAAGVWLQ